MIETRAMKKARFLTAEKVFGRPIEDVALTWRAARRLRQHRSATDLPPTLTSPERKKTRKHDLAMNLWKLLPGLHKAVVGRR